jgi:hypothetical protein
MRRMTRMESLFRVALVVLIPLALTASALAQGPRIQVDKRGAGQYDRIVTSNQVIMVWFDGNASSLTVLAPTNVPLYASINQSSTNEFVERIAMTNVCVIPPESAQPFTSKEGLQIQNFCVMVATNVGGVARFTWSAY